MARLKANRSALAVLLCVSIYGSPVEASPPEGKNPTVGEPRPQSSPEALPQTGPAVTEPGQERYATSPARKSPAVAEPGQHRDPATPTGKNAVTTRAGQRRSGAENEPFSDVPLFLLGSGFAIFVALLGWSDQIRGIARETRELQSEFLRQNRLRRSELQPVLDAATDEEQLLCFTRLMPRLGSASAVRLLPLLRDWDRQAKRLEKVQSWKYYLTVVLSLLCFCCGVAALSGASPVPLLVIPGLVAAGIFGLIVAASIQEQELNKTLTKMAEHE